MKLLVAWIYSKHNQVRFTNFLGHPISRSWYGDENMSVLVRTTRKPTWIGRSHEIVIKVNTLLQLHSQLHFDSNLCSFFLPSGCFGISFTAPVCSVLVYFIICRTLKTLTRPHLWSKDFLISLHSVSTRVAWRLSSWAWKKYSLQTKITICSTFKGINPSLPRLSSPLMYRLPRLSSLSFNTGCLASFFLGM